VFDYIWFIFMILYSTKRMSHLKVDSSGWRLWQVVGSCEQDNETVTYISGGTELNCQRKLISQEWLCHVEKISCSSKEQVPDISLFNTSVGNYRFTAAHN